MGCARQSNRGENLPSSPDYGIEVAKDESFSNAQDLKEESDLIIGEKVISTYNLNLETLDFEKSREEMERLIKDKKGYIENSDIRFSGYEYSKKYKNGDFSIRIPKDDVEEFIQNIQEIANVTKESTNKEDVTNYYRDTESRLTLIQSKEKRLIELLNQAEEVSDILTIESELTDTIYEKEMLEKELKSIDEKIEYVTVNVQLREVRNYSNTNTSDSSLKTKLKAAFSDSWFSFKRALENFSVWLVFAFPYFIIFFPILILIYFIIKKIRNRRRK